MSDSSGQLLALKELVLRPRTPTNRLARFKQEVEILRTLRHSNIAPLLDDHFGDGSSVDPHFFVMPLFQGNMEQRLRDGVSPALALKWFEQMLEGLGKAHEAGVVHRDLKPANVLVTDTPSDPTVALADFGIALLLPRSSPTLTRSGERLANAVYAAPEQRLRRSDAVGAASDFYALGILLTEMFLGRPTLGLNGPSMGSVHPEYGYLDVVVRALTHDNPSSRPQSVSEVRVLLAESARTATRRHARDGVVAMMVEALASEGKADSLDLGRRLRIALELQRADPADTGQIPLPATLHSEFGHEAELRARLVKLAIKCGDVRDVNDLTWPGDPDANKSFFQLVSDRWPTKFEVGRPALDKYFDCVERGTLDTEMAYAQVLAVEYIIQTIIGPPPKDLIETLSSGKNASL